MIPIFKPLPVNRTQCAADNPVLFDSGRGASEYYSPSSAYFGKQTIPHDNKWSDGTPSFMAPVAHYHLLQTETFHVASGAGYWFMQGRKIRLNAGDNITIPRCIGHRFESIPNDRGEPLVILYRYDSQRWMMEERFFRNVFPYMYDCRMQGFQPSIFQLCVFLADCWMPAEFFGVNVIPVPGTAGEYVRCIVNTVFMYTMAVIGILMYGYRRSYPEYYDIGLVRKRIEEMEKKAK